MFIINAELQYIIYSDGTFFGFYPHLKKLFEESIILINALNNKKDDWSMH
jgi:hypothetical protein